MTDSRFREAALKYARDFGWAVLPLHHLEDGTCSCPRGAACENAGKHPRTLHGVKDATTAPALIETWWRRWPKANIGIATGSISGFDVLDIDPRHRGEESMALWLEDHGPLPPTPEQHTGGGGRHILFLHQPGLRNRVGLAPGIDVRADGGYIVAAPSLHASGGEYVWEDSSRPGEVPLAEWPTWLLDLVQPGSSQPTAPGAIADTIPDGRRNDTLASLAGSMRRRGMSQAEIAAALHVTNQHRCKPPLPAAQVDRIAQSIARYAPAPDHSQVRNNATSPTVDKEAAPSHPVSGNTSTFPAPAEDPSSPPRFTLTDAGNAKRLVHHFGHQVRYCFSQGSFFVWDDTRWLKDQTGAIVRMAIETAQRIPAEIQPGDEDGLMQAYNKHALRSQNQNRLQAMIRIARSEKGIPIHTQAFDADPWLFNLQNGCLNLRTGILQPHRPQDLNTCISPVGYRSSAACPRWLSFLDQIMGGNADLIAYLRRAIGYALTGTTGEQVLFMLYGTGANGKSTFLDIIRHLMGDYAQQADFTTFTSRSQDGPRNDVARLVGARFVAASEAESGRRLSEAVVKQLTGGDRITARFLHQEFFEFTPKFKLFLATNHNPQIKGSDHAIWRRIKLIPFTVTIPESQRDKDLPTKLRAELPGIFNWALQGCREWQEHGLGEPDTIQAAVADYREDMDVLGEFLQECCTIEADVRISTRELYAAYLTWCTHNNEEPLKKIGFGRSLSERGFQPIRTSTTRQWAGIRLRPLRMTPVGTKKPKSSFFPLSRKTMISRISPVMYQRNVTRKTRNKVKPSENGASIPPKTPTKPE